MSETAEAKREDAVAIVRRLRESGHVAYFAGGCVRDMLLGLEPKDYDVATDAPPERVRQLFSNTQAVGAAFGVILVRERKSQIEVATFRTDLAYKDGRRPEGVVFTTAEEDAKRRDFTINGMFFDPIENRVIDYVGGQEDLKNRDLRAIGEPNHRFEEDHLRLLRAIRFAARFKLSIEDRTADAMRAHAAHLARISPERVAEELRLMFFHGSRYVAIRLLREFTFDRVLLRFLPSISPPAGIVESLSDEYVTFGMLLAAMVLDAHSGEPMNKGAIQTASQALKRALKLSNDEIAELESSLTFAHLLEQPLPRVAVLKRFLTGRSPGACELLRAMSKRGLLRERVDPLLDALGELAKLGREVNAPPPLVTGDDLTAAGLQPGPVFKKVLDAVYDEQLEGRVASKEAALHLALTFARQ